MISFKLIEYIIVSGSIYGILISLFLVLRGNKDYLKQNIFLFLFVFIYSAIVLKGWYIGSGLFRASPHFLFIPFYFTLGIGPCFYAFTFYMLNKKHEFRQKQYLHLIPLSLQFLFHSTVLIVLKNKQLFFFETYYFPNILPIEEALGMISILIYTIKSYNLIGKYKQKVLNNYTDVHKLLFSWLIKFIFAVFGMLFMWICFSVIDLLLFNYTQPYSFYYPIYLVIVISMFWIIMEAYLNPGSLNIVFIEDKKEPYQLSSKIKKNYLKKVLSVMVNEKLYLKSQLTLSELAEEIDINPKYLSQLINKELNKSFYDFVNEYRIKQATQELISQDNTYLTIAAISEKCGFNSKSTFNEVFKKFTGQH